MGARGKHKIGPANCWVGNIGTYVVEKSLPSIRLAVPHFLVAEHASCKQGTYRPPRNQLWRNPGIDAGVQQLVSVFIRVLFAGMLGTRGEMKKNSDKGVM